MADVTQLRFASLLRQTFGLKATDPGRSMASNIVSVVPVLDTYQPEFRAPRGERLWTLGGALQNLVGGFNFFKIYNPPNSNRLGVLKRATWSGLLPTPAVQPGVAYVQIQSPVTSTTAGVNVNALFKDGRLPRDLPNNFGTIAGLSQGPNGVQPLFTAISLASFLQQIAPIAGAPSFAIQLDGLDLVLPPGTAVFFTLMADTLPTATYGWQVIVEGYERIIDQNELLLPP